MWKLRWALCCGVLWWGMASAHAEKPCKTLAKKVCKTLNKKAFVCMTYRVIAQHSQVDQARCRRLVSENWKRRASSLKRSEATLRKMDALGRRTGPAGRRQVMRYKRLWALCTTARLLQGAPAQPPPCVQLSQMMGRKRGQAPASRKVCKQLALLACRDLGASAFYCMLFSRLAKSPKIKPRKCQLVVNLWGKSQLPYYQKRERMLAQMTRVIKKKKNKALAKKLAQLRKQEMLRVYVFFHK